MLNVGLTGNVAAGKSLVAGWFADWGATVVDADQLVRDVQRPGSPVLAAIGERLGHQFITPAGELDRAALRRHILSHEDARAALNAIVHPAVRAARDRIARAAAARGDCMLVNDIPLLFETLDPAAFDVLILVDADETIRRRRLVEQRGMPPEEADALLRTQLPAAAKRDRSDVVLENNGTPDDLRRAAWDVWVTLRSRAARDLAGPDAARRRVVALICHAGDESFLIGGTLARLADAGTETAVWLVEGAEPGRGMEPLSQAAAALAVRTVRRLVAPPQAIAAALEDSLRQVHPDAVVTIESVDATDDHQPLNAAARSIATRLDIPVWSNLPGQATGAVAALDVRPWLDVKRQAIAAYRAPPCARAAAGAADREYFRDSAQPTLRTDLFGA